MTAFQNTLEPGHLPRPAGQDLERRPFPAGPGRSYGRQRLQDPAPLAKFKARLKEQGDYFLEDLGT